MRKENDKKMNKDYEEVMHLTAGLFSGFVLAGPDGKLTEEDIRSGMLTKLLSYMLVKRKEEVSVTELIDVLWQDDTSDNPAGALKNLMYRLRTLLKKEWPNANFIITGRGSYHWNPAITVDLDTEDFEELAKRARAETDLQKKVNLYDQAVLLRSGPLLQKYSSEYWVTTINTYYQALYSGLVREYAALLEETGYFERMTQMLQRALQEDPLDEELHYLFIRSLIYQNKNDLALEHYKQTKELLYANLGTRPGEQLELVYQELLKKTNDMAEDVASVKAEMQESKIDGAFICEYGVFLKLYNLERRRSARLGCSVFMALITVEPLISKRLGIDAYRKTVVNAMDHLETVLTDSLRSGDVITKYSASQFIIMLPTCQYETAKMVMKRVEDTFFDKKKRYGVHLQYSLEEMDD